MTAILFRPLTDLAKEPAKAHESDACFDLYAAEYAEIEPGSTGSVGTGLTVELPTISCNDGPFLWTDVSELRIRGRSSLSLRGILCHPGTIDFGYRGELRVVLTNLGREVFSVKPGDRIAQCSLHRVEPVAWRKAEVLSETERGVGGFGSTGR